MIYFETYNYLLGLMNKGVPVYSALEVSKHLENDDDDDVEAASHILEEHGIVKPYGSNNYVFVGSIDLMRNFLISDKTTSSFAVHEMDSEKLSLEDITDTKWLLSKKEEPRAETPPKKRKSLFDFDDLLSEDDDNDEESTLRSLLSDTSRKEDEFTRMVTSLIERKLAYNAEDHTFCTHMRIAYPNGDPFVLRYEKKDMRHFFTDNGLLSEYLTSIVKNLPNEIATRWIDATLKCLDSNSALTYADGVLYNCINTASDEEDLDNECIYLVRELENFLTRLYKTQEDNPLREEDEFIIRQAANSFLMNTYNADFTVNDEEAQTCEFELLKRIVLLNEDIKRSHAIHIVNQLIDISKNEKKTKNIALFERLLEALNIMSDFEFKVYQGIVKPQTA